MQEDKCFKTFNAIYMSSVSGGTRFKDANGFLHVRLRFMRTGTLQYSPTPETFPDGVPSECMGSDGLVTVYVSPKDLSSKESLSSLAGMPILRRHDWASPEKELDQVGSIVGEPEFDGKYVHGEAVITDADTIKDLEAGKLIEVSAAYIHELRWQPGEYEGTLYAGIQENILYNHATLLPEGEGRAGPTVRVINSKEKELEKDKEGIWVRVKALGGKIIRVTNADDAEKVAELDAKAENESTDGNERANNEDGQARRDRDAARHEAGEIVEANERKSIIDEMKATIQSLTDERDGHAAKIAELEAMLNELRSSIDSGEADDRIEERADEMQAEREEAAEVMNSNGVMDRNKAFNSFKEKKLRGRALKVFAMNSIREKKGREAIPEEQASNDIAVNAMWDVVKEIAPARTVVGAIPMQPAQAMNARDDRRRNHLAALGYKTEGGEQ